MNAGIATRLSRTVLKLFPVRGALAVLSPGTTGVMIGFPNWPETPIRPILSFLFAPGEA
jgi:hypothetical protein